MNISEGRTYMVEQLLDGNLLKHRLFAICKNTNCYDVILSAEEKYFPAHKIILSLYSDVFYNFLKDKDCKSRITIQLSNIDPKLIHQMLMYMYHGIVNDLSEEELLQFLNLAAKLKIHGVTMPFNCDEPSLVTFRKKFTSKEDVSLDKDSLINVCDTSEDSCDYDCSSYTNSNSNEYENNVDGDTLSRSLVKMNLIEGDIHKQTQDTNVNKDGMVNISSLSNKSNTEIESDLVQNKDN